MATQAFHGDRPIHSDTQDRFGFSALAERISTALTTQAAGKGFVLGVEGRWGSGKSSLLALTLDKLRQMPVGNVAVVEFRPWLIGDRDQLLTSLFEDLAKAVASLEHSAGDATGVTKLAASEMATKVRRFAGQLAPLGKLAGLAGVFVPGVTTISDVIEKLVAAASEQTEGPTLASQKEELSAGLSKLGCRIVVAIDDVDRLEPREVAELLRLVRSVADFPNVSYLLCYDAVALAKAIEEATGVASGAAYLEKIVQTEVAVPQPESFALRRWFSAELQAFAQCETHRVADLQYMIDETGGRVLTTPRAVVRVLDSIRFFWPSLRGRVDLPDLVWLRLIAVGSPNLYRWVEQYVVASVALSAGRVHISEAKRAIMAKEMDRALELDGLCWKDQQFELDRHLPGINFQSFNRDKDERLFSTAGRVSHMRDTRDRRLASPSHSRVYFSLIEPADSVTELDLDALQSAAHEGSNKVTFALLEMGRLKGDAGASKAEKLLDQLRYVETEVLQGWSVEPLIFGLVNAADTLAADERGDDWGYPRIWYLLKDLLKRLSKSLPKEEWAALILALFQEATSLAFLSYLLRDETFGHGFYGNRPDSTERLTSRPTFEEVRTAMLARYRNMGLDTLLQERSPTTMLYAWSQAGGRREVILEVATRSGDDRWFIDFLHTLFGTSSSTEGVHANLSLDAIANFFEAPAAAVRRVLTLASTDEPFSGAAAVIDALKRGIHFDGGDFENVIRAWEEREATAEKPGHGNDLQAAHQGS